MKVLCVNLGSNQESDPWLTLNDEYFVLSVLSTSRGPAKFRILADDGRTPILVDATMFAASSQPLPPTWVGKVQEGGFVEFGPRRWLELGFWERYFDGDTDAVGVFQDEVHLMTDIPHSS